MTEQEVKDKLKSLLMVELWTGVESECGWWFVKRFTNIGRTQRWGHHRTATEFVESQVGGTIVADISKYDYSKRELNIDVYFTVPAGLDAEIRQAFMEVVSGKTA